MERIKRIRGDTRTRVNGEEIIRKMAGKTTARMPTSTTLRVLNGLCMSGNTVTS
jgi:hypothetical protein